MKSLLTERIFERAGLRASRRKAYERLNAKRIEWEVIIACIGIIAISWAAVILEL